MIIRFQFIKETSWLVSMIKFTSLEFNSQRLDIRFLLEVQISVGKNHCTCPFHTSWFLSSSLVPLLVRLILSNQDVLLRRLSFLDQILTDVELSTHSVELAPRIVNASEVFSWVPLLLLNIHTLQSDQHFLYMSCFAHFRFWTFGSYLFLYKLLVINHLFHFSVALFRFSANHKFWMRNGQKVKKSRPWRFGPYIYLRSIRFHR